MHDCLATLLNEVEAVHATTQRHLRAQGLGRRVPSPPRMQAGMHLRVQPVMAALLAPATSRPRLGSRASPAPFRRAQGTCRPVVGLCVDETGVGADIRVSAQVKIMAAPKSWCGPDSPRHAGRGII